MNYFLLDANVLIAYYCEEDGAVKKRARELFVAHSQRKAFLYVPNFCVAEVLRSFARKCWTDKLYGTGQNADHAFEEFKDAFLRDVIGSKILYSYELSRRHLIFSHEIYEGAAKMSFRAGSPPSAFDTLIIAQGLDLMRIHTPEKFWIVTGDGPIYDLCEGNKGKMPSAINVRRQGFPSGALG